MTRIALLLAALFVLGPGGASAEQAVDDDLRIEESAILPSSEGHLQSEAPTMELDCQARPEECGQGLEQPATGPELSEDASPATPQGLAEPIVAEPGTGKAR